MRRCWRVAGLMGVVMMIGGCGDAMSGALPGDGAHVLAQPESVELMTIDPSPEKFSRDDPASLHGYPVLGKANVTDGKIWKALVDATTDAIKNRPSGEAAGAFSPKYALRLTRSGSSVDLLFSFETGQMQAYQAGDMRASVIDGKGKDAFQQAAEGLKLPMGP